MLDEQNIKLRIKLFNYVDVQCNGQSIFKEKQLTAKLKSLLQYFIINKGIICKPEKIIEELWPENEYIERKKVLQTYVHRLRNAIAKDNSFGYDFSGYITIINNKGNYQMEVSDNVELDTDIFIALTKKVQSISEYDELMNIAEEMNGIYDGHYLRDSHHEQMILRQQNYYLQAYCAAMSNILSKLEEMGKDSDVIRLCEKFFTVEDLDDSINIIFLKALIRTQQSTYAVRHYNYIDKKMMETFDVHPSEEMTNLYLSLKEAQGGVHAQAKDTSMMDESRLKDIIGGMISERLKENNVKYSFAMIRIIVDPSVKVADEMIEHTLIGALRKNDMFTQISPNTAMALLYEAKEEFFENIKQRIIDFVEEHYGDVRAKVEINIWPITNII